MERKYYRQYEKFNTIVPDASDFPTLDEIRLPSEEVVNPSENVEKKESVSSGFCAPSFNFRIDDIIIIGLIILLLGEDKPDNYTIALLGILFLSEYIF